MPIPYSKILFIVPKVGDHFGVVSTAIRSFAEEFKKRHWDVSMISPDSLDFLPQLIKFGGDPEAIIHFGIFLYDLRFTAQNHFEKNHLIDLFRCQTLCTFGDHPLTKFMWERIQNMCSRTVALSGIPSFFDEARFMRPDLHRFLATNPSIHYARREHALPFAERSIDVLVPLSFGKEPDISEILETKFKAGTKPYRFVSALYESLRSNRAETLLQIAQPLVREIFEQDFLSVSPDNVFSMQVAAVISGVDMCVRKTRRCEILDALLRDTRGLRIVLLDNGAPEHLKASGIQCIPPVNAPELGELMGRSKSIIHVHPTYPDGLHERIVNGMASGSVLLSDFAPALDKHFEQDKEWICARRGESLNEIVERVGDENLTAIAQSGREKVWRQNSVEQHVSKLLTGLSALA